MLQDPSIEGLPVDAKETGSLRLVPARLLEKLADGVDVSAFLRHWRGATAQYERHELRGKVIDADVVLTAKNERVFQRVFQFPDIARPREFHEEAFHIRRDSSNLPSQLSVELFDKVLDQKRNILASVSERRQRDLHHFDPVVEVLPELATLDPFGEVPLSVGNFRSAFEGFLEFDVLGWNAPSMLNRGVSLNNRVLTVSLS